MIDTQNSAQVFLMFLGLGILFFGGITLGGEIEKGKEYPFAVAVPVGLVIGVGTFVSLIITIIKSL